MFKKPNRHFAFTTLLTLVNACSSIPCPAPITLPPTQPDIPHDQSGTQSISDSTAPQTSKHFEEKNSESNDREVSAEKNSTRQIQQTPPENFRGDTPEDTTTPYVEELQESSDRNNSKENSIESDQESTSSIVNTERQTQDDSTTVDSDGFSADPDLTQTVDYTQPQHKRCSYEPDTGSNLASGSGFFISQDGTLLTNEHVIRDADEVFVIVDGTHFQALVVAKSKELDLAALTVDYEASSIPIADARTKVGQEVIVLGYPNPSIQGTELKATFGHVNALSGIESDTKLLQFSAPIQTGNSGGPVLNAAGELIAVATSTLDQNYMLNVTGTISQNVNYGVKSDLVVDFLTMHSLRFSKTNAPIENREIVVDRLANSVVTILAKQQGLTLVCDQPLEESIKNDVGMANQNITNEEAVPSVETRPSAINGRSWYLFRDKPSEQNSKGNSQ